MKRILCLFLAVMYVFSLSNGVFAAEIYPGYPKAWQSRTSHNQAALVHYYGNLQTTYSDVSIATAYGRWAVSISGKQYVTNTITYDANYANGHIYYLVPTSDFWYSALESSAYWCYGFTVLFDSNGIQIGDMNYASTTSYIRSANVFVTPVDAGYDQFNGLSASGKNCVITHEIGHALGFGHVTSGSSIMEADSTTYTSLQTIDRTNLTSKYPYS